MAKEKMPYEIIDELAIKYDKLSDAEVLDKLRAIPPIPDEDDAAWNQSLWDNAVYPYLALWQVVAVRRMRDAIPLILDRACFGDPGETMRNMCHALEAIVNPNWSELTPPCIAALKSQRAGTRLWAARQLGRLRDADALPALESAAADPEPRVREWVQAALEHTKAAIAAAKPVKKTEKKPRMPKKQQAKRKRSK